MKCPKCGSEIPEGCLLCENCGEDIQIVPDFDPAVENSIIETMSNLAENLTTPEEIEEVTEPKMLYKNRKYIKIGAGIVFIIGFMILCSVLVVYFMSSDYKIRLAANYADQANYDKAIEILKKASEEDGDYVTIHFAMAEYYQEEGDNSSFLNTLLDIINYDGISEDDASQAYKEMIDYYLNQENYDAINSLLQNCGYSSLQDEYSSYMANAPEFNYIEGSYTEIVPLKIISNTRGHIYYTLDGTTPDENSSEYISPVFLDTGDYIVTALFVNEYGVKSPLSKSEYHIDVSTPFSPEVDAYSGEYYTPQLIHVEAEDGCSIYYTVDGSNPTIDSTLYNGFLPMPLGKSVFKFVAVDENQVMSEITTRNYDLELMTEYTTDDAQTVILDYLVSQDQIVDKTGVLVEDSTKKMYYSFACCVTIADQGDFYVFSEYILDSDGTREKTGNYYAVGVYNLPLYITQYDANTGTFALSGEQLNPDYTDE